MDNCTYALRVNPQSIKAFFRRGQAQVQQKKYEEAKEDIEKCLEIDSENRAAKKLLSVVEKQIALQRERAKKVYSKMFG